MPIYAYRCAACGHAKDVLQKVSDPVLTVCPACGASAFQKQVTAAGFQLKGSGWYVTDFRDGGGAAKKTEATNGNGQAAAKPDAAAKADGEKSTGASASNSGDSGSSASASTPAPAPAPAVAAPAASPPPAPTGGVK